MRGKKEKGGKFWEKTDPLSSSLCLLFILSHLSVSTS